MAEGAEVDLQQHRNDHHPDEHPDRNVHLGHLEAGHRLKDAGKQLAQCDADRDVQGHPHREVALEEADGGFGLRGSRESGADHLGLALAGVACYFYGASLALAAVFREIDQQGIHLLERRAVDEVAALTFLRDQACIQQLFEMKGQRVGRGAQAHCHDAGGHSLRASND